MVLGRGQYNWKIPLPSEHIQPLHLQYRRCFRCPLFAANLALAVRWRDCPGPRRNQSLRSRLQFTLIVWNRSVLRTAEPNEIDTYSETGWAYTIALAPGGNSAYTIENNNDLVSGDVFVPVGAIYPGVDGLKIAVDPSGSFVYVPEACSSNCPSDVYNVIHQFSITKTGDLLRLALLWSRRELPHSTSR